MKKYIVYQQDETDCGACALKSIILYYDGYVPLEIIKMDTKTSSSGTNFLYLKDASEKYGFSSEGIHTFDFDKLIYPCIAQVQMDGLNHFVTIFKAGKKVKYIDPAKGIVETSVNDFLSIYTGYILNVIPQGNIVKYNKNNDFKLLIKDIYFSNKGVFISLFVIILFIITLSLILNFNIILISEFNLTSTVIALLIMKIFLTYLKNIKMSHLNKKISGKLLKSYIEYVFNLPFKYLHIKKSGDLINRVSDLNNIKEIFSEILIQSIINFIFLILTAVLLFILSKTLSIIIFITSLIYFIILKKTNKKMYDKLKRLIDKEDDLIDILSEYLNKIKTIKTLNTNYFINNVNKKITSSINEKESFNKQEAKYNFLKELYSGSLSLIILLVYLKEGNFVSMIIFLNVYTYFNESFTYFVSILPSFIYFKDIMRRIKSVFDIKEENEIISKGDIKISNVNYSYDGITPVLTGINININKGSKVFLSGDNATGKTTLLNLITKNLKPLSGKIEGGGVISFVPQRGDIFKDTIMNNIILEKPFNQNLFEKIEQILDLKTIIKDKNSGYKTYILNIENVSGGEKQKIILARALYSNFDTLIMDESLSEISKKGRTTIIENILKEYKTKTIIYVSHNDYINGFNKQIFLHAREDKNVNRHTNA